MTESRRSYDEPTKARAIGTVLVTGQHRASELLGIPRTTLQQWMQTDLAKRMLGEFQSELADETWSAAREALDRLREVIASPDATARDLGVVYGILVDKAALMSGQATSRHQSMNLNMTVDPDPSGYLRQYDVTQYEQKILAMLDRGTPEDLDALEAEAGLLLSAERELVRIIDAGEASDPIEAMKIIVKGSDDGLG